MVNWSSYVDADTTAVFNPLGKLFSVETESLDVIFVSFLAFACKRWERKKLKY